MTDELNAKIRKNDVDIMCQQADSIKELKNAMLDILKAVITKDNGVVDTIWVDEVPIGDFIGGFFDEELDHDELQMSPYRCKKIEDMFETGLLEKFEKIFKNRYTSGHGESSCLAEEHEEVYKNIYKRLGGKND